MFYKSSTQTHKCVLGAVKAIPPDLQLPHSEIDPMPFQLKPSLKN